MQALMDVVTNFSLFDYIFLRRVNNAINNCGDNGIIQPVNQNNINIYSNSKKSTALCPSLRPEPASFSPQKRDSYIWQESS